VVDIEIHLPLKQDHLGADPSGLIDLFSNNLESFYRGAGPERARLAVNQVPSAE
jgi:hypothetical protein